LGKVQSFKIDSLDLFFNSNDHNPPHFHARKSGVWEIRIFFLLCSKEKGLSFTAKFPPNPKISSKEEKQILKLVLENRTQLLIEWEQIHNKQD